MTTKPLCDTIIRRSIADSKANIITTQLRVIQCPAGRAAITSGGAAFCVRGSRWHSSRRVSHRARRSAGTHSGRSGGASAQKSARTAFAGKPACGRPSQPPGSTSFTFLTSLPRRYATIPYTPAAVRAYRSHNAARQVVDRGHPKTRRRTSNGATRGICSGNRRWVLGRHGAFPETVSGRETV